MLKQVIKIVTTPLYHQHQSLIITLLLALVLNGCATPQPSVSTDAIDQTQLIISPNDQRDYRYLQLTNGLRVLLISDPEEEKAAASLDVHIGSAMNPAGRDGLAHFLEHMLFLGTNKYPKADDFHQYIAAHGGQRNAYTGLLDTNYFFDINARYLEGGLDRFAQFFISPKFDAQYVERERNAVESEYRLKFKNDGMRQHAVSKLLLNPKHPLSRFQVGSTETLADRPNHPVRQDLIAFYQRYYTPDQMTLVLLAPAPLEQLEALVHQQFSAIPASPKQPIASRPSPYSSTAQQLNIQPLKDIHQLRLSFPLPAVDQHYRNKPLQYLGWILGHEGEGSLLALLKENDWADYLSAGQSLDLPEGASFDITIGLTTAGRDHRGEIISLVFDALDLTRQHGIQATLFEDQQLLQQLAFQFQQKGGALSTVNSLASQMHYYPPEHLLVGPYLMEQFEPRRIEQLLDQMRPSNLLITWTDQQAEVDQIEPSYQVPYGLSAIDKKTLAGWRDAAIDARLQPPGKNPYLPTNTALLPPPATPSNHPSLIKDQPGFQLWFQQDGHFKQPRSNTYFAYYSPQPNRTAKTVVQSELLLSMVTEQLNPVSYQANMAGLYFSLYRHGRGIGLNLSGYSDKQPLLLDTVIAGLQNPEWDSARFQRLHEQMQRSLLNARKETPYRQLGGVLGEALMTPNFSDDERLHAVEMISLKSLKQFHQQLFKQGEVLALIHGNSNQQTTEQMAQKIADQWQPAPLPKGKPVVTIAGLNAGDQLSINKQVVHNDSAILLYLQSDRADLESQAFISLLNQKLSADLFHQLRTVQQLGYVVYSSPVNLLEESGLALVVQSPQADPQQLVNAVTDFLQDYRTNLRRISKESFQTLKSALLEEVLKKEKRLSETSHRFWYEITRNKTHFQSRQQLAKAIKQLTLSRFIERYETLIDPVSSRQLLVYSAGTRHTQKKSIDGFTAITNPAEIKASRKPISRL